MAQASKQTTNVGGSSKIQEKMSDIDVQKLLEEKISMGKVLHEQIHHLFAHVNGIDKLNRRIATEIKSLLKLRDSGKPLQKTHVMSSNLHYLSAVVGILQHCGTPSAVLQTFSLPQGSVFASHSRSLEIDVISEDGLVWYKGIARNPKALHQISQGEGGFKQRSIIEQARCYVRCANHHQRHFCPPKVVFHFTSGVGQTLAKKLENLGIVVEGERYDFHSENQSDSSECEDENLSSDGLGEKNPSESDQPSSSDCLFLDITAMIAYVSALTNGGANFRFPRPIYNQQAEWERSCPAKPQLEQLFNGKRLFSCVSAVKDFRELVQKMGGPSEKQRTSLLLEKITVVPDEPSQRIVALPVSASMKARARTIFGTADLLKMVCVTANTGFVRSARGQGFEFSVLTHAPRVLTEGQEALAAPLYVTT
nr:EOG090X0CWG [Lepidurus arcticus]